MAKNANNENTAAAMKAFCGMTHCSYYYNFKIHILKAFYNSQYL